MMEENSAVDINIMIKEEPLDEHGYSSALQSDLDSNTFTAIKTDPTEPDKSYGVFTDSQLPQNDTGGLLGMPVISSPPIINRAQLLNIETNNTMYSADKPTKKQIAALVKVAAPTTACTTIKQEVDRACHRLSQEGEQSLFLSVNVEKKLCSYVGSDMGRQFLSKRPDIMEHFFQFCQVLYKAEVDGGNLSSAATSPAKKKMNIRRPNILQQRQSTSNTLLSVSSIAPSLKTTVVVPPSQNQTASQNLPLLQPKPPLSTTVKMPEVTRILNSTPTTKVNSVVPQSIGAGQKRKNKTQGDEPKEKQDVGVDMPFRMNIKKLKAGATKSTLLTLRQTLESKSSGPPSSSSPCPINPDPCNTDITVSSEDVTDTSSNQNTVSYGEVLKKAMKTSLSEKSSTLAKQCDLTQEITPKEFDLSLIQGDPLKSTPSLKQNVEPPHELFSKTIKLSDSGLDVHSMFLYFTTKKVKKSDNRPKTKTSILGKSNEGNSTSSPRPYSFRQRKKKRFGDDYVEDFKEENKEEGNEENGGKFEIEIKKEVDEEIYDDDKDEDFKLVVSEEEEEEEENDDEIENSTFGEDDQNDESEIKYFNENSLEDLFNDHCYSAKRNCKGSFQCTQCQMMFKWSTSFLQHMVEKHEDLLQELNLHQCVMCDKCFVGIRDLANHYRNTHKQLDCFFCKKCNATFNSAVTYDRHMETCKRKNDSAENDGGLSGGAKKKTFVCNICLKVLKTAEGLAKHLNMHKKDAYYICDVCGVRCTSKQTLSCHKYNRHQAKLGNYSCPNCDRRFMSIWTMFRHNQDVHGCTQVICRECGKYFDTQEQLMSHITKDHPHISEDVSRFSCEDCGKWFDQARYLYVHYKEVHRKQRSICGFCGKGFGNRDEFHEHKKTHDLSIPNTCKICAKTCNSPEDLEKHMHYHMRGKTLHECGICKEVFIRRQDLIEHMVTHTKKLPFICKECGKGFKNKGKLKVHMISHVSYRPFQCDICGMAFKMKATLSTHIKRHKELKPFKCDYCPLRFKSVEGSRNHMLHKHIKLEDLKNIKFKVYKCEYCNKLMGQKHMYMRHVRLHTGERPCKCDECGRSFTMPATLNVHKKTHLLRKPHHCEVCNFGFIDAHKLGKHYQTLRHKQMVEQKKRIKELAETRSKNMQKVAKTHNVMKSFDIKLEQVNVEDYFDVPERTQIQLGDEMVVVERASEDPLQGNSQTEAVFQGYTDSCGNLVSVPTEPNSEFTPQALQNTVNQLLVPKTENMDE